MYRSITAPVTASGKLVYCLIVSAALLTFTLAACETPGIVEADMVAVGQGGNAVNNSVVNQKLAAARAGTAAFHDIENALAAGFIPIGECVEHESEGGMGFHYFNPANTALDPANPQILVYEPQKNGRKRLVAAEYLVPFEEVGADAEPPSLFGQDFHPTPPAGGWTLHAWIWYNNPSGLFAEFNPRVSCEFAE